MDTLFVCTKDLGLTITFACALVRAPTNQWAKLHTHRHQEIARSPKTKRDSLSTSYNLVQLSATLVSTSSNTVAHVAGRQAGSQAGWQAPGGFFMMFDAVFRLPGEMGRKGELQGWQAPKPPMDTLEDTPLSPPLEPFSSTSIWEYHLSVKPASSINGSTVISSLAGRQSEAETKRKASSPDRAGNA